MFAQDLTEQAFVVRGKVLDDNIGQPCIVRQMVQELLQCLKPSCRSTDADNGTRLRI